MQYSSPDYPLIRFDLAVSIHNIAGIIVTLGLFCFCNWKYGYFKW